LRKKAIGTVAIGTLATGKRIVFSIQLGARSAPGELLSDTQTRKTRGHTDWLSIVVLFLEYTTICQLTRAWEEKSGGREREQGVGSRKDRTFFIRTAFCLIALVMSTKDK